MTVARRDVGRVLRCGAGVLAIWTCWLVVQDGFAVERRGLDTAWVGLDIAEVLSLLLVAALVDRRHYAASPVAAFAAALFGFDAWFDVMSATPRFDYVVAVILACGAELPLTAVLAWVSARSLGWAVTGMIRGEAAADPPTVPRAGSGPRTTPPSSASRPPTDP